MYVYNKNSNKKIIIYNMHNNDICMYTYDNQIGLHNPCFSLFITLISFDNHGSEIDKNNIFLIFLCFDKLSSTKTFFILHI